VNYVIKKIIQICSSTNLFFHQIKIKKHGSIHIINAARLRKNEIGSGRIAIAEAREKGDLSENAEYDAAKDAQGMLEAKIAGLEIKLANARIIDESQLDDSKISVLSTVTVEHVKMKKQITYKLVPESEADVKTGKISVNSPVGQGLMGKEVGDIAVVKTPNGDIQFKVISISIA
jgi:transcription elongation factor GreA